ncbi:MAG: hypothetical protein ACI86M_001003 [Saprospiraceae bacterium]|jgi:hypothetical protein
MIVGKSMMYLLIALFIGLFVLQFYFRVRVVKVYQKLVKNRVQFDSSHIFSGKKMEAEILPKYPEHKEDILKFVKEMRHSLTVASIFIVLIFAAAVILRTWNVG